MSTLESQPIDGQLIFGNARDSLLRLLEAEAIEAGLIPSKQLQEAPIDGSDREHSGRGVLDGDTWMTFSQLMNLIKETPMNGNSTKPGRLRTPEGIEIDVSTWTDLLRETCEWLIRKGCLTKDTCPVRLERQNTRYLIHTKPEHPDRKKFRSNSRLSNGLYVETHYPYQQIASYCINLLAKFHHDRAQFHVRLSQ